MFLNFFLYLKENKLPVTITEYLTLLEALDKDVIDYEVEEFYFLSKTIFVKNEIFLERYDYLFGQFFKDISKVAADIFANIPEDWLKKKLEKELSEEEKAKVEAMGGLDELTKRLKELLEEQKERHEGGNKWIGTAGTSPFGNNGYNPEGIKIGKEGGQRSAVRVWESGDFKNYDEDVELNTRNIKMALKRLRILTREGVEDELDLEETINETSRNAGMLDIKMRATRRNKVKVLLLLDVGGSMDDHIELCAELFSAAKYQFKNLEQLYFHNCIYETMWKDNDRRNDRVSTWDILHKYNQDWKIIIVGDASMAPYEITSSRGSIEHYNEESGLSWLEKIKTHFPHVVWLNPVSAGYWQYTQSIKIIRDWSENRMFPLTISGLTLAMKCLKNNKIRFEEHK
jgi:uncharacterized protein